MRFIVRFVGRSVALIAVVVAGLFFVNSRSGNDNTSNQVTLPSDGSLTSDTTASGNWSKYAPVTLVDGTSFNVDAVVSQRPVVFWFWAPG